MTEPVAHIRKLSLETLRSSDDAAEWSALVDAGEYQGALQRIEQELHADGEHFTARLWWVLCQLELKSLPAMALTTPLEEIFEQLESKANLQAGGCEAFLRVSELLAKRGQLRLAVVMAERAYTLSRLAQSYSAKDRNIVAQACRSIVQQELDRAHAKLESAEYIQGLESTLDGIEDEEEEIDDSQSASVGTEEPKFGRKKNKAVFNSKSILEQSLAEDLDNRVGQSSEAQVDSSPNHSVPERESQSKRVMPAIFISGAACLLLALALQFDSLFNFGADLADVELAMASPVSHSSVPVLPVPPRLGAEAVDSSELDSVQSRLNQLAIGTGSRSGSDDSGSAPVTIEDVANDPEVDKTAMQMSTEVDVAPLEPERRPSPPKVDQRKVPLINPDDLQVAKVEDLGQTRAPSRVQRGRDGRMYGPPPTSARGLDGGAVQGVEVTQFSEPELYRTVTATAVLEAPSVLAQSVERLDANARIQVVSKMGQWLELRSTAGKRGYIFAQDAVRIK